VNIFRLLRRRATPPQSAAPAPSAPEPWDEPGHFQIGDRVHCPPDHFPEQIAWIDGDRIGVITNPLLRTMANASRSDLRHLHNCPPCMADAAAQAAAEEDHERAYWAQWPEEEREIHDRIMQDMVPVGEDGRRFRFGPRTPVRPWMRTELDGHLLGDEMPSLTLGRIWDPIDWPRIEREHGGDGLTITNPWDNASWPTIRSAFEILQEAGYTTALDVSVEMALLDDGMIGAEVIVTSLQAEGHIDDATYERAAALLGDATEFPCSHMGYPPHQDRPGLDRSQPYSIDNYTSTGWNWSGGAWMADFNPPPAAAPRTLSS
jgi:hypothetical protein